MNILILQAVVKGPKQQSELRRDVGSPAQTTLRAQLNRLAEIGAIEKHRRNRFPGVLEYELTKAGRDLLFVVDVLEYWLEKAPDGSLALGSGPAKAAIKALVAGWSTTMLRVLAARPLSLTELDGVIGSLSYPSLERRLGALRLAGQVKACPNNGNGTPYAVTEWLRQGVAPLAAAARWERRHAADTTMSIRVLDVEATFLLAVPLLKLPAGVAGSCRLAVEIPSDTKRRLAGVAIEIEDGRVASCTTELRGHPSAWALGSSGAWLEAIVKHDTDRLELGGDCRLAGFLVDGLHERLFGAQQTTVPNAIP